MVFRKVCSSLSQDKVQMFLPSPYTGRMQKSGLFLKGSLSSLYPEGEEKGACWPLLLFTIERNGPRSFLGVAESSPERQSLFRVLSAEESLQIGYV